MDRVLKEHIDRYSFSLVLQHILERVAVDDALFLERERAKVTLNSIGDGVISTDNAGKVTYLNPVAERLTGWSLIEASGRRLFDVFHIINGDTREPAPSSMEFVVRRKKPVGPPHNSVLAESTARTDRAPDRWSPVGAKRVVGESRERRRQKHRVCPRSAASQCEGTDRRVRPALGAAAPE